MRYLRFMTQEPTASNKVFYKYNEIAKITGIKMSRVMQICQAAMPNSKIKKQKL